MKRSLVRVLVSFAVLLLAGCGDGKSGKGAPDVGADVADGGADLGAPDANDVAVDGGADAGAPPEDGGADATASGDAGADAEVDMAEPLPPVDVQWPADPAGYAATARVSYVSTLKFPVLEDDRPVCCRDFGAVSRDEGIDNSLAILASSLLGFGVDLDQLLADSLATGDLVVLLDHRELDGATDADNFALAWLRGSFAGATDYASASAGTGTFALDAESLGPDGAPKLLFNPATMTAGAMAAGPAELTLLLPIALQTLDMRVSEASMRGEATVDASGVAYTDGTISGWIALVDIFTNLNTLVATECACLGLGATPLFEQNADGSWAGNCVAEPEAVCDVELCVALAGSNIDNGGACTLTKQLLPQLADIDTDGDDTKYEAISMGLQWSGVPGALAGPQP